MQEHFHHRCVEIDENQMKLSHNMKEIGEIKFTQIGAETCLVWELATIINQMKQCIFGPILNHSNGVCKNITPFISIFDSKNDIQNKITLV